MNLAHKPLSLVTIYAAKVVTVFATPAKLAVAKHKVEGEKPHLPGMSGIMGVPEVGDKCQPPFLVDGV